MRPHGRVAQRAVSDSSVPVFLHYDFGYDFSLFLIIIRILLLCLSIETTTVDSSANKHMHRDVTCGVCGFSSCHPLVPTGTVRYVATTPGIFPTAWTIPHRGDSHPFLLLRPTEVVSPSLPKPIQRLFLLISSRVHEMPCPAGQPKYCAA